MIGYLARVKAETSSRFWINNPTLDETAKAIDAGAVGCTTNPTFMAGLARRAPDEILATMRAQIRGGGSDSDVADRLQLVLVSRIADRFEGIHSRSGGQVGFVSIQGAPGSDEDSEIIVREALEARTTRANIVPKIPATAAGLAALDEVAGRGHPCIITEVFSLAQLIAACERYMAATALSRYRPPFFISPITGILGDHLRLIAAERGVAIPASIIARAGVVLARSCHRVVADRGYPVTLLAGGARATTDLTDLVGQDMHATINYSTVQELEALDLPVVETVCDDEDPGVVAALVEAFEAMRIALDPAALPVEDFAAFSAVRYFRDLFTAGWTATIDAIAAERSGMGARSVST